jgi:hypothetical protein
LTPPPTPKLGRHPTTTQRNKSARRTEKDLKGWLWKIYFQKMIDLLK